MGDIIYFLYTPFTGLGLYNGYRGDRWLKNRIRIFQKYVVPSVMNQSTHKFYWIISWRPQEKTNPQVIELGDWLDKLHGLKTIFTFDGILFWDDKYPDDEAERRLRHSLAKTLPTLNIHSSVDAVCLTLQPSDDMYVYNAMQRTEEFFTEHLDVQAVGYKRGWIMRLDNKKISEYNPTTNPPFYTIKFPRDVFIDPDKHFEYAGRIKSHEYVKDHLKYETFEERGFIVGTHGENISTGYNIPFRGRVLSKSKQGNVLRLAGISDAPCLKVGKGWKRLYFRLPHRLRRKIRYWMGERLVARLYAFLNQ